jgi:glutamine---fructose-6-phosphate transaminase (isomerizing)
MQSCASLIEDALPGLEEAVAGIATTFAYVGRMYVIGRGIEFGTAREIALKLTETCRIAAEPVTSTDLAHGPIAALDAMFPVWTIASRDECLPALVAASALARAAGAMLVATGSAADQVPDASSGYRFRRLRWRSCRRCCPLCRASCSLPRSHGRKA